MNGSVKMEMPNNFEMEYFGLDKGSLKSFFRSVMLKKAIDFNPTKVFLHLGENDIDPNLPTTDVVAGICEIVEKFLTLKSVKKVIIGSLLQRKATSDSPQYNDQVGVINRFLQRFYSNSKTVVFWNLRGLVNTKKHIWLSNGINLNEDAMTTDALQIKMAVKVENAYKSNM